MGVGADVAEIGGGLGGLVTDVPSLLGNAVEGDVHGMVTDGRNVLGHVADVAKGLDGLGLTLGELPGRYLGIVAKIADSKILASAQLVIDGERKLTGEGEPEDGLGYAESATRLDTALNAVIDAKVADDRWDGAAAETYGRTNSAHQHDISATAVADTAIASILESEAAEVARARRLLDDTSQWLYDFGLATAWMTFVPPLVAAKAAADAAAAAAALRTTTAAVVDVAAASVDNAARIRAQFTYYEGAALDTSGDATGCGGGILIQHKDLAQRPARADNPGSYTIPRYDPQFGPPATPYHDARPGRSAAVAAPTTPPPKPPPPAAPPNQPSRTGPGAIPPSSPARAPGARPPRPVEEPRPRAESTHDRQNPRPQPEGAHRAHRRARRAP